MDPSDALADQPEPAGTVAEAAIGSCGKYEVAFEEASRRSGGLPYEGFERIKKDTVVPKVLARVMGIRAARAKLRMESPGTKPAIDYRPHVGGEMPLLRIAALCAAALGMAG